MLDSEDEKMYRAFVQQIRDSFKTKEECEAWCKKKAKEVADDVDAHILSDWENRNG